MDVDQAQPLAHRHPGTPVGDLFPLGNSVFGSGSRSSPRPIWAGELRSHSPVLNTYSDLETKTCACAFSVGSRDGLENVKF